MKIAVVTNNGNVVSQHFGRAKYYAVYTVEEGKIVNKELRERNAIHHHSHDHSHNHDHNHDHHGDETEHQRKHDAMAQEINDCQVLIAGGMGRSAYSRFFMHGLNVVLTDETNVEDAVKRYIAGNLPNLYAQRTH